ncbi:cytochrome c551/c552 [Filimonas lacunae]|nr:cytochrome c551/c552 [Filimonas lacunae]
MAMIAVAMVACGQQSGQNQAQAKPLKDNSSNPDYQKGIELVAKNDCLSCHKIEDKMLGPSYRQVANKYENNEANIKMLANKVIQGGQGVWGPVPMTAHPQLSEADAQQMIKYIFLLKN